MDFINPEVKAKYKSDRKTDPVVHVPGGKTKDGWKGKLSTINIAAADKLFEMKSNLLELVTGNETVKQKVEKDNKRTAVSNSTESA